MTAQKIRALHALAADELHLTQRERALAARNDKALFRVAHKHFALPGCAGNRLSGVDLEPRTGERGQRDRPRVQPADQAVDLMRAPW